MLDALLEKMPGVKIDSDGRITVNGRFVEKLLLDGKDFFDGDKLVLLQNLPAYTVKDIQVYEKATGMAEVLGQVAASRDQYQYVMDVRMKKTTTPDGWPTPKRARAPTTATALELSGWGIPRSCVSAPTVSSTTSMRPAIPGETAIESLRHPKWHNHSQGGGINYGFFNGRKLEITGDVTASYTHTDRSTHEYKQNFLTGGDTYTRRWDNALTRNLDLNTSHFITLRPANGNQYNTRIELYGRYGDNKRRSDAVEGSFSQQPQQGEALKDQLILGMPQGSGIINRYIDYVKSRQREWGGSWQHNSTFRYKDTSTGVTLSSHGYYYRGLADASNDYLLQYASGNPSEKNRLNPEHNHRYEYWVGGQLTFNLSSTISLYPSVAFCHRYDYNDNTWLNDDNEDENGSDPSSSPEGRASGREITATDSRMMIDRMMRLDPRNSYMAGLHHSHEYFRLHFKYFKEERRDGKSYSLLSMNISATANVNQDSYRYNGLVSRHIKKNYLRPEAYVSIFWAPPKRIHTFELKYNLNGQQYDMLNLLDHTFDYDPLNLRSGNPDLRQAINNSLNINYNSTSFGLHKNDSILVDQSASQHQ